MISFRRRWIPTRCWHARTRVASSYDGVALRTRVLRYAGASLSFDSAASMSVSGCFPAASPDEQARPRQFPTLRLRYQGGGLRAMRTTTRTSAARIGSATTGDLRSHRIRDGSSLVSKHPEPLRCPPREALMLSIRDAWIIPAKPEPGHFSQAPIAASAGPSHFLRQSAS